MIVDDFIGAARSPRKCFHSIKFLFNQFDSIQYISLGAARPQQIKSKSIFPLGREDWIWFVLLMARRIAQTSLSFNTADAFITIQSSLLY